MLLYKIGHYSMEGGNGNDYQLGLYAYMLAPTPGQAGKNSHTQKLPWEKNPKKKILLKKGEKAGINRKWNGQFFRRFLHFFCTTRSLNKNVVILASSTFLEIMARENDFSGCALYLCARDRISAALLAYDQVYLCWF